MIQYIDIHCLGFWPDYDASFLASAQHPYKIHIINPYLLSRFAQQISKYPRILREPFIQHYICNYIKQHDQDFFVFGENRVILKTLAKFKTLVNGAIILRNCITKPNGKSVRLLKKLKERGYSIWSFDQSDCDQFGFSWYRQFISPLTPKTHIEPQVDFAFIGQDKGRKSILDKLAQLLNTTGYSYNFDIRSGNQANLSFEQYLSQILRAKCLVDIVQTGQTGLTLRPLEALIYNRKLLTNNTSILSQDFYSPENILVFNEMVKQEEIESFMNMPLSPANQDIVNIYGANQLFKTILVK